MKESLFIFSWVGVTDVLEVGGGEGRSCYSILRKCFFKMLCNFFLHMHISADFD